MPLQKCQSKGKNGWRWGDSGKCYIGPGARRKAIRQSVAIRASGYTGNARVRVVPSNPLKADPSRTTMLRNRFTRELRKRFRKLRSLLIQLIVEEDAFGLAIRSPLTFNQRWRFLTSQQKVQEFLAWLKLHLNIVPDSLPNDLSDQYWAKYIQEGFQKGAGRAFDEVRKGGLATGKQLDFYNGTKEQFLASSFGRPESVNKVKLLASRVFTELRGMTEQLAATLGRILTDGLVQGMNPRTIARNVVDRLGISQRRAETIARTEIIRAHAEGQLDSLEQLGVAQVGVAVEWSTAGDDRVCPQCKPLEGAVFSIKEATGLIPRHPNCLPGDCFVTTSSRIAAASKRWFDGDFIVIETAAGRKLTCTPNHPILTDLGWVAAQDIDLFSKIVCDSSSVWKRFVDGENQYAVATIHDVVESFFSSSQVATSPVPLTAVDFHGDAADSEVAVIGTDRSLSLGSNASRFQVKPNPVFYNRRGLVVANKLGTSRQSLFIDRPSSTYDRLMSSPSLASSLLSRHSRPFQEFSLGLVSDTNTAVLEPRFNQSSRYTEFDSQSITGLTNHVFLDDVVRIDRFPVSCHVYNLQTGYGWYTANGIITHNCRCAFVPANVGEPTTGQTRGVSSLKQSIKKSVKAEGATLKTSRWVGADKTISKRRPKSQV